VLYFIGEHSEHENPWNNSDPIKNNWIAGTGVVIYKQNFALHEKARKVYYRPTVGDCSCQYNFDGQDTCFLIWTTKGFYYGMLFN